MSLDALITPFPWSRYSKKLMAKIENPHNGGFFSQEEAEARAVRFAMGIAGSWQEGNSVALFWLVDPEDGVIIDAKFQVFGQSALIGAADVCCELLVGKNYDQASRFSADIIDKRLRDHSETPAFPKETSPHLNLLLEAVDGASEQCRDLPLATTYVTPPLPTGAVGEVVEGGYPGWAELPLKKKLAVIEAVLDADIRPYIALDAGGVEVINLLNDREIVIAYQGSCTSCYSSVGSTLSAIQQLIRNKVHPDLVVVPDSDSLTF